MASDPPLPAPSSPEGPPPSTPRLRLTIDDREVPSGLAAAVVARWPEARVGRLEVGDVEVGERIVIERKTVADLIASLSDGRLWRQLRALSAAAVRPLLLLEGEDAWDVMGLAPEALRGLLLMVTVGFRVPILRTANVDESATYIARIARHEARRVARSRSADTRSAARESMQVLAAIPGVSDRRARRLLREFGSISAIAAASERDLRRVRSIGRGIARAILRILAPPPAPPDHPRPASEAP